MRELSLFSGAGGGLLGTKLLDWNTIGYVEINDYCQKIIRARIEDGMLNNAPIFGDIKTFISEGFADSYTGMVDVITAGFPCQPFSNNGKRKGETDERNMWPATIDVIRRVRPKYCYLENVPGLLTHAYARRIFGDLAESGFNVRWRMLSAAELGAPHKRDRLWIAANSVGVVRDRWPNNGGPYNGTQKAKTDGRRDHRGIFQKDITIEGNGYRNTKRNWPICGKPIIHRASNGIPSRMDRLKALGNGQVPAVVASAWQILNIEGLE